MQQCRVHIILYTTLAVLFAVANIASCRTVEVEQGSQQLIQALQDEGVDTIVLGNDYSVASELPGQLPVPIQLHRNVTIRGRAGVVLDLAFRRAVVLLCPSCTVTLQDLMLKNARRGSGSNVDFFVGDDHIINSAVLLENVKRHRLACTPSSASVQVLEDTPRSAILPNRTAKQQFAVKSLTVQGVTYPEALHLLDFTEDLPLVHQEGRGHTQAAHWGGYALGSYNVVYLCDTVVSEACLAEKSPDACVNEQIDSILTRKSQGGSGPPLAAIIAPIVVIGALVAAVAVLLLHRRRRRQRQRQRQHDEEDQDKLQFPPSLGYSFSRTNTGVGPPGDSVSGLDSASDVYSHSMHSMSKSGHAGRRSLEIAAQPRGRQQGWQLVSSATSKFVQLPGGAESDVEFGAFVGAGSYGRVYRARWAGHDVACKVIQHDRGTLAAVEAEAALMLTLHHPNVVQAYHYCTFTYTEPLHSEKSRGSRSWSHGGMGNQRASSTGSHSSGGSGGPGKTGPPGPGADSAQQLNRMSSQTNSGSNSGSGSGARVMLLRQQQQQLQQAQQQAGDLPRQDSSDVLITNLSFDAQAAQEAVTIASSIAGISSVNTKGSAETEVKVLPREQSVTADAVGIGDGGAVKHKAETWLVQEYCDLGTLGGIASSWDPSDECDEQMLERLTLLCDTARGLEALHADHVVHGDVNARNVLVSSSNTSEIGMSAKVADLGLSRCLAQHATHRTTNSCGTMSHMAPELLRYGRLSPAVDTYAFGIMMWELYNQGQPAFDKLHYGQFFETVVLRKVRPCVPAGMPPDYELLMCQCWASDPAERPTAAVLRQCLEVMLQDRESRVAAAAAAIAAAAAGPDASEASGHSSKAGMVSAAGADALPPPGVAALSALHALLPHSKQQQPRGVSPVGPPTPHGQQDGAQAAAAGLCAMQVSPAQSSSPLSVVSLSALFPDLGTPPSDSVLFVGEEGAAAAAAAAAAASTASRPTVRPPVNRVSPGPGTGSPLGGSDLEAQLDTSVHSNRLWFV